MDSIKLSASFKVKPEKIYSAWLDSKKHAAMTGSEADIDARINGKFTAWDGYILSRFFETGKFLR
jgi:activator of HSP90 ATPase